MNSGEICGIILIVWGKPFIWQNRRRCMGYNRGRLEIFNVLERIIISFADGIAMPSRSFFYTI